MFDQLDKDQLAYLARSGAGFRLSATGRDKDELAYIARSTTENARLTITNVSGMAVEDLVYIARSGKGSVVFEP